MDTATNQPVVIDNGCGSLKAGFSGEDVPKCVIPAFIGRPKYNRVMIGALEGDSFVGQEAADVRGLLKLNWPSSHSVIHDWADMERIWARVYSHELHATSEDHPVLLTDAPLNPIQNREKAAEIFFETFNVPALFISPQAVLSLYASGRTSGVVLDCGEGSTTVVPVYEGFAMPHSIGRIDVAGRDVTNRLQLLLRRSGHVFHTSAEKEVVRQIKEQACYIAMHPDKEEQATKEQRASKALDYRLPDGKILHLEMERFRAPEVLFRPDLIGLEYEGIHECLVSSIERCDLDLRKKLYGEIMLAGGSTLFPGFGDRLLREMRHLAPRDARIKILAPPERKYSTWIGGSIMASLPAFRSFWVTAEEYADDPRVIHRKMW